MQMVFHLGVHGTDRDRLLKTLLNNRAALQGIGTEVVTPNRHRGLFDEALASLNGGTATPEMEQERRVAIFDLLEDNSIRLPARSDLALRLDAGVRDATAHRDPHLRRPR